VNVDQIGLRVARTPENPMPLPSKCPMHHDIAEAIKLLGEDAYPSKIPDGLASLGHYRNNVAAVVRGLESMREKGWVTRQRVGRRDIYKVEPGYPGR
jgi:hypothetical protein